MPIRIQSKDITIQQVVDLSEYMENLKLNYELTIITEEEKESGY